MAIGGVSPLVASLKLQSALSQNITEQQAARSKILLNKNTTTYHVDTYRARQGVDIETQRRSAKVAGNMLQTNLQITTKMGEAVLEADDKMQQIITLLKEADNDGTISTRRNDITTEIRELGGEIYHLFQKTESLGHRLLNENTQPLTFTGAYGHEGSPALVVNFPDDRLQTVHDTLDGIDLSSQALAVTALTTVENLRKDEFGTMRASVLGVVGAITNEVALNTARQVSLDTRLTAVQGIDEDKLRQGLAKLELQHGNITESIMDSQQSGKDMLTLMRSTPAELIGQLTKDTDDDQQPTESQ